MGGPTSPTLSGPSRISSRGRPGTVPLIPAPGGPAGRSRALRHAYHRGVQSIAHPEVGDLGADPFPVPDRPRDGAAGRHQRGSRPGRTRSSPSDRSASSPAAAGVRSRPWRHDRTGQRIGSFPLYDRRPAEHTRRAPTRLRGTARRRRDLSNRLAAIPGLEVAYQRRRLPERHRDPAGTDSASGRVVVVGAHYDSHASDSATAPGAPGQRRRRAIILELARVMSAEPVRR